WRTSHRVCKRNTGTTRWNGLLALAYVGHLTQLLELRHWSGTEAQPTRACAEARDPPHRVDIRPSRVKECAPQPSKIGGHRPPLLRQFVWHDDLGPAKRARQ